jgi:hypothetical protein
MGSKHGQYPDNSGRDGENSALSRLKNISDVQIDENLVRYRERLPVMNIIDIATLGRIEGIRLDCSRNVASNRTPLTQYH